MVDDANLEDLEEKLTTHEQRFSWKFWTGLHENHGSSVGYALGFLVILLMRSSWMLEEFIDSAEGHSVSKTVVVLFLLYSYSVITFGFELAQFVVLVSEIYFPYLTCKFKHSLKELCKTHTRVGKLWSSKYFYTMLAGICSIMHAFIGSKLWFWFWWNHTCKSYHDRTCKGSWVGELVIKYRDNACYDGTASSIVCEKFVSYLPIMFLSVFFVFLGNVLLPLINDQLSLIYPPALQHSYATALRILEKIEKEKVTNKSRENGNDPLVGSVQASAEIKQEEEYGFGPNEIQQDRRDKAFKFEDIVESENVFPSNSVASSHSGSMRAALILTVNALLLLDLVIVAKLLY